MENVHLQFHSPWALKLVFHLWGSVPSFAGLSCDTSATAERPEDPPKRATEMKNLDFP